MGKYAEKEDVAFFVKMYDESYDDSRLTDRFMKIVDARIDQMIISNRMRPVNIRDRFNLLWSAAVCLAMELLCNIGDVKWATGDIALERLNKVTYAYQRWQPMFFFAQGAAEPFYQLLPHDTYRMMAYAYVRAYCRDDFFKNYDSPTPIPRIAMDDSSRGWNWNVDESLIEAADISSSTGLLDLEEGELAHYQYLEDEPL